MADLSSYINVTANNSTVTGNLQAGKITTTGNISAGNVTATGDIDIDGEGRIGGNLVIVGNVDFSGGGSINQITSPYGVFTGNTDGSNALYAGAPGYTPVPAAISQFTGDGNYYLQINSQNLNHGNNASIEYVITGDLGTDTTDYIDLGFSSSAWDGTQENSLGTAVGARDGWLYVQGGGGGGNLVLGTTTTGTKIKFNAGGPNAGNTIATIDADGFSTSGNVTAGHLIGEGGNISNITAANVTGLGNVALINKDGNSSNVLYGNGVFAPAAAGSYGDSNVTTLLASYGSNTISTTGNITSGNLNVGLVNATANISTTGYFISGNQATGGFQLGNVNSRIKVGGSNSYITLGQNILLNPDQSASASAGLQVGGGGYILAPNGSRVLALGSDGSLTVTTNLSLPNGGNISVSTGNVTVGGNITRSGNITATSWGSSGVGLKLSPATYTDNSTVAGTLAAQYIHSMGGPTFAFSNAVTVTNAATLYVNSPTAGTNATLTNAWSIYTNGNVGALGFLTVTGNITGGNLVTSGQITATGNITTSSGKFVGDGSALTNVTVNAAGNIVGTSSNVTLVAGSYSWTFDNGGTLTLPTGSGGGNEGGEIAFTQAVNSTLAGNTVVLDQYVDRIRFFEGGGNARGAYIDLTQAADGVGTLLNNRVSGIVNAGTFVTMDLLKATLTSSGQRGLSLAATTGSFSIQIGGNYSLTSATTGGSAGTGTINTTPSASQFNWNFLGQGDTSTYIITDTTNSRSYRVILQIGASFNNNLITIERLV